MSHTPHPSEPIHEEPRPESRVGDAFSRGREAFAPPAPRGASAERSAGESKDGDTGGPPRRATNRGMRFPKVIRDAAGGEPVLAAASGAPKEEPVSEAGARPARPPRAKSSPSAKRGGGKVAGIKAARILEAPRTVPPPLPVEQAPPPLPPDTSSESPIDAGPPRAGAVPVPPPLPPLPEDDSPEDVSIVEPVSAPSAPARDERRADEGVWIDLPMDVYGPGSRPVSLAEEHTRDEVWGPSGPSAPSRPSARGPASRPVGPGPASRPAAPASGPRPLHRPAPPPAAPSTRPPAAALRSAAPPVSAPGPSSRPMAPGPVSRPVAAGPPSRPSPSAPPPTRPSLRASGPPPRPAAAGPAPPSRAPAVAPPSRPVPAVEAPDPYEWGADAPAGDATSPSDVIRADLFEPEEAPRGPASAPGSRPSALRDGSSNVAWQRLSQEGHVFFLERQVEKHRLTRSVAVRLKTEGLLVVHPQPWLDKDELDALAAVGNPEVVLSVSGQDHEAIRAVVRRFPHVQVVAPPEATKALRRKVTTPVYDLKWLTPLLGKGSALLVPGGLRRGGEVWVQVPTTWGMAWIVGEAFVYLDEVPSDLKGMMQGLFGLKAGLTIPPGFRRKSIGDTGEYRAWLFAQLRDFRPTVLIPPDGRLVRDTSLAVKLRRLAEEMG